MMILTLEMQLIMPSKTKSKRRHNTCKHHESDPSTVVSDLNTTLVSLRSEYEYAADEQQTTHVACETQLFDGS